MVINQGDSRGPPRGSQGSPVGFPGAPRALTGGSQGLPGVSRGKDKEPKGESLNRESKGEVLENLEDFGRGDD